MVEAVLIWENIQYESFEAERSAPYIIDKEFRLS